MYSELVEQDFAKFVNVADFLALERDEIGDDTGGGEVDDAREGLVEQGSNRLDGRAAGFSGQGMDLGFETLNPRSNLPEHNLGDVLEQSSIQVKALVGVGLTLGSLSSRRAGLMPSSLK